MKLTIGMSNKTKKDRFFPCPCCGELALSEKGAYEICTVCLLEDDPVQSSNSLYAGGANAIRLIQARENWLAKKFFSVNKTPTAGVNTVQMHTEAGRLV